MRPRYRYWVDWDFIASSKLGRLFIGALTIVWGCWIIYHVIDCVTGLSTGRYPIK